MTANERTLPSEVVDSATAQRWCAEGIRAVLSLWDHTEHSARRHSRQSHEDRRYNPTATFHALSAAAECGIWHPSSRYDARGRLLFTNSLAVSDCNQPPSPDAILTALLASDNWFAERILISSHISGQPSPRDFIVLERLYNALYLLLRQSLQSLSPERSRALVRGLHAADHHVIAILTMYPELSAEVELVDSRYFTPSVLLNITRWLWLRALLYNVLHVNSNLSPANNNRLQLLYGSLPRILERHIDRQLARSRIPSDPSYDSISLAFALRGLCLVQPAVRSLDFFASALECVVQSQNVDGCWPDGVSVAYVESGDIVQQPSVAVALLVAETVFEPRCLVDVTDNDRRLLDIGLPALRKMARFLISTYTSSCKPHPEISGWTSDRVRWPYMSETWITAMATLVFQKLWLCELAAARMATLRKYGVSHHASTPRSATEVQAAWVAEVIDPDEVIAPASLVFERFILPIVQQREMGELFPRPSHDAVSFIIFGPPGSGKTFFVKQLARFLDWPLVVLNPGHFIQRGLELIEATSREVFDDLSSLRHCVVFFDECDELFRDREPETVRDSILAFATASILPKLQDLHDARQAIFVAGTNYLSRIDRAVRRPGRFDELLFFDRPDGRARQQILSRHGVTDPELLKRLVHLGAGLTYKEVLRLARAESGGADAVSRMTSREDYIDWSSRFGSLELNASRLDLATRRLVEHRWSETQHFDAARAG